MKLTTFDPALGMDIAMLFFILNAAYCLSIYVRYSRQGKSSLGFFGLAFAFAINVGVNYWLMSFGWFYVAYCIGGYIAAAMPIQEKDQI